MFIDVARKNVSFLCFTTAVINESRARLRSIATETQSTTTLYETKSMKFKVNFYSGQVIHRSFINCDVTDAKQFLLVLLSKIQHQMERPEMW